MTNYKSKIIIITTAALLFGAFSLVLAAFNEQINFQGKLTDSSDQAVSDGTKCMQFLLYTTATGDSSIWSEEWTVTSDATLSTTSGLFSALLGSNSSLSSVNFNQTSLYLEVKYDASCDATYEEVFSPRKRLGAVPAAFESKQLAGKTWATPDAIGSGTPNTGAFTTLSASGLATFSYTPQGTGIGQGSLYINPSTATADYTLLGLAVGGTEKFRVDAEGDVVAGTWKGTAIGAGYGGTGQSSYATGDMLYASGAAALSKLTIGTSDYILTSSGTAPQWSNSLTVSGFTCTDCLNADEIEDIYVFNTGDTITGLLTATGVPSGTGVGQGSLYINPATATADYTLLGLAVGGTEKFRVDAEGDVVKVGNITMADLGWIGIGSSAGLIGFDDSTTDYIYFSNANVGIGTTTPGAKLHLGETRTSGTIFKLDYPGSTTLAGALYGLDMDLSTNLTQGSNSILGFRMTLPSTGTADRTFSQFLEGSTTLYNFKTTQAVIDSPVSFGSAGDVSISYDLQFTNDTASYIKSYAPLYIEAGDPNFNRDLTFRAAGSGSVIVNDTFLVQNTSNSTTAYQFANAAGTTILDIDTSNSRIGIGTTGPDRLFHAEISGTATSDVTYAQRLSHITSGTAAAGFGTGIEFEIENASGTNRVASAIQSVWEDAVDATEDASLRFLTIQNGTLTEAMRIDDLGRIGIGTTNPGGGTGSSVLSLYNSSSAPTALANTTHLYSSAGEGYWMDASGDATLQTPHDPITGEWIFYSQNLNTGRELRVEMEQLVKFIDQQFGTSFVQQYENGELVQQNLKLEEDGSLEGTEEMAGTEVKGSFIGIIKQALTSLKEIIVEKLFARTARFEKLEMIDQRTGDVYCTWIEYGETKKVRGECDSFEIAEESAFSAEELPEEELPELEGCTDPEALNYNPQAAILDNTCEYQITGCIDPEALNYNLQATIDDGFCLYESAEPEATLPETPAVETTSPSI